MKLKTGFVLIFPNINPLSPKLYTQFLKQLLVYTYRLLFRAFLANFKPYVYLDRFTDVILPFTVLEILLDDYKLFITQT